MDKLQILEKRIEGEIERRAEEDRKVREKIKKLEKRVQDLEEKTKDLEGASKKTGGKNCDSQPGERCFKMGVCGQEKDASYKEWKELEYRRENREVDSEAHWGSGV